MEIKNLKKAAQIILKAIKDKERIIIYGDTDLDGTTSVIILEECIKSLGGKVAAVYFPDRDIEGYGINKTGLDYLKKYSPALLITVDFGISNYQEVNLAKKLGFRVIIIDHHEVLGKIPKAEAVVDPKQKGDKYPFKGLSAAGVVFKLSERLFEDKMAEVLKNNFLELTALSTVADMMPRESENKFFIEQGLSSLKKSFRPGIKVFFENDYFKDFPDFSQKVFKIISILNVRDVKNRLPASFRLLTTSSFEEAKKIVSELLIKHKITREKIEKTVEEIEEKAIKQKEPIIFAGETAFDSVLLSSAASILCQKHQKPTFLFRKMDKESQGTIRTPKNVNSLELLKKCSKYLLSFGGHAQASGFRIKNKDLDNFKNCLVKNLQ
jgi:single-stranded-DNA-specific exonuclease